MDTYLCTKFKVNSLIPLKVIEGTNRQTDTILLDAASNSDSEVLIQFAAI